MNNLPNFIINGVCKKNKKTICNIGYACDACPYNNSISFDGENDYISIPYENKCYCCHKVKEGTDIIYKTDKRYNKITKTETIVSDIKFVCNSCNHIK